MAVPKRKTSKARKHRRGTANVNISVPNLSECPQCHELTASHTVCAECGYYDGNLIVTDKKKVKK